MNYVRPNSEKMIFIINNLIVLLSVLITNSNNRLKLKP